MNRSLVGRRVNSSETAPHFMTIGTSTTDAVLKRDIDRIAMRCQCSLKRRPVFLPTCVPNHIRHIIPHEWEYGALVSGSDLAVEIGGMQASR